MGIFAAAFFDEFSETNVLNDRWPDRFRIYHFMPCTKIAIFILCIAVFPLKDFHSSLSASQQLGPKPPLQMVAPTLSQIRDSIEGHQAVEIWRFSGS